MFEHALRAWLARPGPTTLEPLRHEILRTAEPDSQTLSDAAELMYAHRYSQAQEVLLQGLPGLLLSPAVHAWLARCASELGQGPRARFERLLASRSMSAILLSGSGTRAQPYQVLRVSDEYDACCYLGAQPIGQEAFIDDEQLLDQLTTTEGAYWFALPSPRMAAA